MRDKARAYLAKPMCAEVDEGQSSEAHIRAVRASVDTKAGRQHIPFPVLKDPACMIYSHRSIIGRKYGMLLCNPGNPRVL